MRGLWKSRCIFVNARAARPSSACATCIEFFYNVWWLRLATHRTFIKFAATGLVGVIINLGTFQILLDFGVHKLLASPLAIELSIISNFLLNNYWTFAERAWSGASGYGD